MIMGYNILPIYNNASVFSGRIKNYIFDVSDMTTIFNIIYNNKIRSNNMINNKYKNKYKFIKVKMCFYL